MKETFYFQHDYNARNDPKLQDVLIDLGVEGIGVYWCIIEQLYEQGGKLPLRSCKSIAFALHVDLLVVKCLINNYGLFQSDGQNLWSESVLTRLNRRSERADKRKLAAIERWRKSAFNSDASAFNSDASALNSDASAFNSDASALNSDASAFNSDASALNSDASAFNSDASAFNSDASAFNSDASALNSDASALNSDASAMHTRCKCNALASHKEKEIKEKNNIKENNKEKHETAKRFVPPTIEEVKARIVEMGYTFDAEAFIAFYQSNGWMVGKTKMKDWKAAMVTWQKREPRFPCAGKNCSSTTKKANEEW